MVCGKMSTANFTQVCAILSRKNCSVQHIYREEKKNTYRLLSEDSPSRYHIRMRRQSIFTFHCTFPHLCGI